MIRPINKKGRLARRVVVNESGAIVITSLVEGLFSVALDPSGRHGPSSDDASPRRENPYLLRYYAGFLGPRGASLRAGDRVEVESRQYEVLADPREVRRGRFGEGYEVPVLAVERLYPFLGILQEQGGVEVTPDVRFSAYAPNEAQETTGTYENLAGEAPLEYHDRMRINRQLAVGTGVYKVTAATVDRTAGYVDLELRRSGIL